MQNLWWVVGIVIVAGLVWWGYVSTQPQVQTSGPITIAAVLGLTGDASVDALNVKRGIDLAVKDLANRGVVVEVTYEDDGTDAAKTVSAIQRILATGKPNAFLGLTWDFNVDAGAPILIENETVVYSSTNTAENAETRSPFVFYGSVANEKKRAVLESYIRENGIKRVGLLIGPTTWGSNHESIVTRAAEAAGATVVLTERVLYGTEATTIPTLVTKFRQHKVDMVFTTHSTLAATVLLNKLQEQSLDVPVLGTIDVKTAVSRGDVTKTSSSDWLAFVNPGSEEFAQKYRAAYEDEPGVYADGGYDALMVLVEAIQNTDGSGQEISDYLRSGRVEYKGYISDSFTFNGDGGFEGGEWILQPVQ